MDDGSEHVETCWSAIGSPDGPLGRADVLAKITQLADGRFPAFSGMADEVIEGRHGDALLTDTLGTLLQV